jgi:hypothetical protein
MMLRRIGVVAGREFRRFHSVGVATARNWKYGRGIAHKWGWAGLGWIRLGGNNAGGPSLDSTA